MQTGVSVQQAVFVQRGVLVQTPVVPNNLEPQVRDVLQVKLHALMSVLSFQATALVKVRAGREAETRWMVRKVA